MPTSKVVVLDETGKIPIAEIPDIGGTGDMTKAVYDSNDDGIIATAQLDMTAIIAAVLLSAHPVGSTYESVVSTSPATLFGGTWTAFGAGRVLVGIDAGDPDFDTVEETGGAKTVQSSAQTFSGDALATHQHGAGTFAISTVTGSRKGGTSGAATLTDSHSHTVSGSSEAVTGGTPTGTNIPGAATSVVQPYIVVYKWKRTA